jgi:hypothetical protein
VALIPRSLIERRAAMIDTIQPMWRKDFWIW